MRAVRPSGVRTGASSRPVHRVAAEFSAASAAAASAIATSAWRLDAARSRARARAVRVAGRDAEGGDGGHVEEDLVAVERRRRPCVSCSSAASSRSLCGRIRARASSPSARRAGGTAAQRHESSSGSSRGTVPGERKCAAFTGTSSASFSAYRSPARRAGAQRCLGELRSREPPEERLDRLDVVLLIPPTVLPYPVGEESKTSKSAWQQSSCSEWSPTAPSPPTTPTPACARALGGAPCVAVACRAAAAARAAALGRRRRRHGRPAGRPGSTAWISSGCRPRRPSRWRRVARSWRRAAA